MPKLTYAELTAGYRALKRLTACPDLPISKGLQLARARQAMEDEVKLVDERQQKLIEKHAERDENGNPVKTEQGGTQVEDTDAFMAEREELMEQTAEIGSFHPVPLSLVIEWDEDEEIGVSMGGDDVLALLTIGVVEEKEG